MSKSIPALRLRPHELTLDAYHPVLQEWTNREKTKRRLYLKVVKRADYDKYAAGEVPRGLMYDLEVQWGPSPQGDDAGELSKFLRTKTRFSAYPGTVGDGPLQNKSCLTDVPASDVEVVDTFLRVAVNEAVAAGLLDKMADGRNIVAGEDEHSSILGDMDIFTMKAQAWERRNADAVAAGQSYDAYTHLQRVTKSLKPFFMQAEYKQTTTDPKTGKEVTQPVVVPGEYRMPLRLRRWVDPSLTKDGSSVPSDQTQLFQVLAERASGVEGIPDGAAHVMPMADLDDVDVGTPLVAITHIAFMDFMQKKHWGFSTSTKGVFVMGPQTVVGAAALAESGAPSAAGGGDKVVDGSVGSMLSSMGCAMVQPPAATATPGLPPVVPGPTQDEDVADDGAPAATGAGADSELAVDADGDVSVDRAASTKRRRGEGDADAASAAVPAAAAADEGTTDLLATLYPDEM